MRKVELWETDATFKLPHALNCVVVEILLLDSCSDKPAWLCLREVSTHAFLSVAIVLALDCHWRFRVAEISCPAASLDG